MKKLLIISGLLGTISGGIYLCTSWGQAFLACFVCMMAALVCWIEYEMDLADQEIEMHYKEWELENQPDGMKLILTTTSIERAQKMREDLIETWKEIA